MISFQHKMRQERTTGFSGLGHCSDANGGIWKVLHGFV